MISYLTPLDISSHQFSKTWRGCDAKEVQSFLALIAEQLGKLTRENQEAAADLRKIKRELEEHRQREETLRQAMLTAQKAVAEIKEQAQKEAQIVIAEAQVQAEKIVYHAQHRVNQINDDLNDIKMLKVKAVEDLRSLLNSQSKMLQLLETAEESCPKATVTVLEHLRPPAPPLQQLDSKIHRG